MVGLGANLANWLGSMGTRRNIGVFCVADAATARRKSGGAVPLLAMVSLVRDGGKEILDGDSGRAAF